MSTAPEQRVATSRLITQYGSVARSLGWQMNTLVDNAKLKKFVQCGLVPRYKAELFPSLDRTPVKDLNGKTVQLPDYLTSHGSPSLAIVVSNRSVTQKIVETWYPVAEKNNLPLFEVVVVSDLLYRLLGFIFRSTVRSSTPKERRHLVLHAYPSKLSQDEEQLLGTANYLLVNAVLLDKNKNIRWRSNGMADEEDKQSLAEAVAKLQSEK
ncbi:hypothetical protein PROFUN_04573 [Planoprotostelium fungivorum]|uniref:Uncharacterized protein n=1 Tax=Planoprotostelium fungivorum TaxID=1890364 RepID=A0A2P6NBL4_9EUKA|nr:hypothetical protein PROFUN_04573 [Planoprotostelium fungivorum]